jgi:hypothetical protein
MGTEGATPFPEARVRWRDGTAWLVLRNEFAMVEVALVEGRNGPGLAVRDSETGAGVTLDPLELEALTRLRHEDLARHVPR